MFCEKPGYHVPVDAKVANESGVRSTTSADAMCHCKVINSSDATRPNAFMVGWQAKGIRVECLGFKKKPEGGAFSYTKKKGTACYTFELKTYPTNFLY